MIDLRAFARSQAGRFVRFVTRTQPRPEPRGVSFDDALHRIHAKDIEIGAFINIGAGEGHEIGHLRTFWPQLQSLLIDMDPRFEEGWRKLAQRNPGVRHIICAAGDADDQGFFDKSNDVGGVLLDGTNIGDSSHATPIRRIDSLVTEFNLPGPYFLKFDTHGVELNILAGASETLKQASLVMMEVYNFKLNFVQGRNLTFDEMSLHMKSLGFRCADMCDPLFRPKDATLWQFHMFFIRSDHPVWQSSGYN